jgi:hypothetical protein
MHKCQYWYWHHLMPVPVMYHVYTGQCTIPILVLEQNAKMPIPVRAPLNASTLNVLYPYWYWNVHKVDLKEVNT